MLPDQLVSRSNGCGSLHVLVKPMAAGLKHPGRHNVLLGSSSCTPVGARSGLASFSTPWPIPAAITGLCCSTQLPAPRACTDIMALSGCRCSRCSTSVAANAGQLQWSPI